MDVIVINGRCCRARPPHCQLWKYIYFDFATGTPRGPADGPHWWPPGRHTLYSEPHVRQRVMLTPQGVGLAAGATSSWLMTMTVDENGGGRRGALSLSRVELLLAVCSTSGRRRTRIIRHRRITRNGRAQHKRTWCEIFLETTMTCWR